MNRLLTVTLTAIFGMTAVLGQAALFTEDFESGTPSTDWQLYRAGEEEIQAAGMSSAPLPLTGGGDYVGYVQDIDGSYSGAAIALAGDVMDSNYTIEADVYCYTFHPGGSAYTGIIAYADSSLGVYVKLAADFDNDNRFRLYNNKLNFQTFQYSFHYSIDASGVDTTEGWHHMKVAVQTLADGNTSYTCYYDGAMLGEGAYIDTSEDRLANGHYGVYAFQQDSDGIAGYFDNIVVVSSAGDTTTLSTDPEPLRPLPEHFTLLQNYPNPFNPATTIEFQLLEGGGVTMKVFNLTGQLLQTLQDGYLPPGYYRIIWDGRDNTGMQQPSGVYFYHLKQGSLSETRRMLLLK